MQLYHLLIQLLRHTAVLTFEMEIRICLIFLVLVSVSMGLPVVSVFTIIIKIIIIVNNDFQQKSRNLFLTPNNLRYYASMMGPRVSINSRIIHVAAGTAYTRFLTVPLAGPSELTTDSVIKITIGLKPKRVDSDPIIGISDGTTVNEIVLADTGNYGSSPPCRLNGINENVRVPTNTPPYSEVT